MKKEDVRRAFPECCKVADAFRDAFGEGTKLVYAQENGKSIGRRTDDSNSVNAKDVVRADYFVSRTSKRKGTRQ